MPVWEPFLGTEKRLETADQFLWSIPRQQINFSPFPNDRGEATKWVSILMRRSSGIRVNWTSRKGVEYRGAQPDGVISWPEG